MNVRRYIKRVASFFLIPLTRWYLRKERTYRYGARRITVRPGVFHPGLFSSTKFLLSYLDKENLKDRKLLELGCGTGLISIIAARSGAIVTASDLSTAALENAKANAALNEATIKFLHSDLFDSILGEAFDWIIINPPYYAKDPVTEEDLAWYCGQEFGYFKKLFSTLPGYLHAESRVLMVLTKACDLDRIRSMGADAHFSFDLAAEKSVLFDGKNFLFLLRRV